MTGPVAQVANLKAQPSVAKALANGTTQVFGWYYDILSGRVEQYDEQSRQFRPLTEVAGNSQLTTDN